MVRSIAFIEASDMRQLGITSWAVRNKQLEISLNALISIQFVHWAALFYILTKQSNSNSGSSLNPHTHTHTQWLNEYVVSWRVWLTAWYFIRLIPTVILPVAAPGSRYTSSVLAGELVGLTGLGWVRSERPLNSITCALVNAGRAQQL